MNETAIASKAIEVTLQYAGPVGVLLLLFCMLFFKLYKDERKERMDQAKEFTKLYIAVIEDNKKLSNILAGVTGRGVGP